MAGHAKPRELVVPRPALAFRVGITGARSLDPVAEPEVRRQIEFALRYVAKTVSDLGADPACRHAYRNEAGGGIRAHLRAISPLADGADRLFAETATELGYNVEVPLPFARDECAKDFDEASRAEFERWLGSQGTPGARPCLAIDGGRGDEENRSYEAVGRVVVRNCDLLVAVWDGHPAKGRGGTADIVRFAAKYGPPVWWIDAAGHAPPRLIKSPADLRRLDDVLSGDNAVAAVADLLRAHVMPPPLVGPTRTHGIIGSLVHKIGKRSHAPFDPLRAYLDEVARPKRPIWGTYATVLRLISWPPLPQMRVETDPLKVEISPSYWTDQYEPADRASVGYSNRYRSSYILVFALATLAVACAIVALAYKQAKAPATFIELLCLGAIALLVYFNQKWDWQSRWISYRFLAELCRKQEVLAMLGWSLPASDLRRIGAEASPGRWVGWYFDALLREAPMATGDLFGARLATIRDVVRAKLIFGQATYHAGRKQTYALAAHRLARWGEIAFLVTGVIVAVKFTILLANPTEDSFAHGFIVFLGVIAAILPALSAAFVGIRAYSEVELLEQQSARLETTMKDADERIRGLKIDRPLASQDLAADVYEISSEMLTDVKGWADLFLLKAVEPG